MALEADPKAASTTPVATPTKWVYRFEEGSASMRSLLGGKGAGCAEMTRAGLPVTPGFTITTEACNALYENKKIFPNGKADQAMAALDTLHDRNDKGFRSPQTTAVVLDDAGT